MAINHQGMSNAANIAQQHIDFNNNNIRKTSDDV